MSKFFATQAFRSIVGMVAAVVIGGTFLVAAAGPAVAAEKSVNSAQISNIVRGQ